MRRFLPGAACKAGVVAGLALPLRKVSAESQGRSGMNVRGTEDVAVGSQIQRTRGEAEAHGRSPRVEETGSDRSWLSQARARACRHTPGPFLSRSHHPLRCS